MTMFQFDEKTSIPDILHFIDHRQGTNFFARRTEP